MYYGFPKHKGRHVHGIHVAIVLFKSVSNTVEETRVLGENRNFNELLPILYTILSKLQISHRFVLFLLVLRINMNMRCIGIGDALENYVNCLLFCHVLWFP
jgi:hypothetical protein